MRKKPDYEQLAREHELAHAEREHYGRLLADLPHGAQAVPAEVPDPLEPGAMSKPLRSIRDDLLGGMLARGQIDQAMFNAGRDWQGFYEQAEIGAVRGIDPTKEAVDGGRMREPITDAQRKAVNKIAEADKALGIEGCALVRAALSQHNKMTEIAASSGLPARDAKYYLGRRLRECLNTLAMLWGYAARPFDRSEQIR